MGICPRTYLAACSALVLCGCEELQTILVQAGYVHDLGIFNVEQVEFVPEMPPFGHGWEKANYLQINLSSSHKLSDNYPTYWVGVASDYCPLKDDHKLITLGVTDDLGVSVDKQEREPVQKSSDGLFHYQVFVVPAHPMPGKTLDDYAGPQTGPYAQSEYDIVEDGKDLCLQIFGGDHYNVFARSSLIRISFEKIRAAANTTNDKAGASTDE